MSFPIRFESYEIFRIVLSGYFALGAVYYILYSLVITRSQIIYLYNLLEATGFVFLSIALGLFIGILLYAYDHPKHTKFYRERIRRNFPHLHLRRILCDQCQETCENIMKDENDAIATWFYLLYSFFDPNSQQTIHYFGSIYRIYADMRAVFGLLWFFQIVAFVANLLALPLYGSYTGNNGSLDLIMPIVSFFAFLFFWIALHPEWIKENKLSKGDSYMSQIVEFQKRYLDLNIEGIKERLCIPRIQKQLADDKEQ